MSAHHPPTRVAARERGSVGALVFLEIALFATVFIAGGVLAWLAAFGEQGPQPAAAPGPLVGLPTVPPPGPGGGGGTPPALSPVLGPVTLCLEAAGFNVEDNSQFHPEVLGSLRVTRGGELLFLFLFSTPEEASAFEENYGPDPPPLANLGKVIVEYTGRPSPGLSGPVETCGRLFG